MLSATGNALIADILGGLERWKDVLNAAAMMSLSGLTVAFAVTAVVNSNTAEKQYLREVHYRTKRRYFFLYLRTAEGSLMPFQSGR